MELENKFKQERRKMFTKAFIVVAVLLIIAGIIIQVNINRVEKLIESEYEQYIGDTIVFNKDTLEIVNYEILSDSFVLSDGSKISTAYGKLKLLKH